MVDKATDQIKPCVSLTVKYIKRPHFTHTAGQPVPPAGKAH